MQLLQCTALPPGGSGHCNSCNALTHCLGAQGSGTHSIILQCTVTLPLGNGSRTPFTHCHTARGQCAVELVQCNASPPGACGHCNSCNTLRHCLGAVGSAIHAMHCLTASGQWAVLLVPCIATPHGRGRQWNLCNARAHQVRGRGVLFRRQSPFKNGTLATHSHTTLGQ